MLPYCNNTAQFVDDYLVISTLLLKENGYPEQVIVGKFAKKD